MEVSKIGLFGRLKNAVFGIVFGLFLVVAGPALLFWNEGRAVKTAAAIAEGAAAAQHVDAEAADSSHEGGLVHLNGRAATEATLTDDSFGVAENAITLVRVVEMYQWKEEKKTKKKKNVGGSETKTYTYTYSMVWSDDRLDSSRYHDAGHENPDSMPFKSKTQWADTVTVGGFTLDDTLKGMISGAESLVVTADHLAASQWSADPDTVKLSGGRYYLGTNPATPVVGDVRIGFKVTRPGDVSVLGMQVGSVLGRYKTSNGYEVHDLSMGTHTVADMFQAQESANNVLAWALRAVGFFMVFGGLAAILAPIRVLADIVPFFGGLAGGMIAVVAFLGAGACTLPTIGFAWVFYRPLLGIALLVVGGAMVVALGAVVVMVSRRPAVG